jgi:hypothetical protein
MKHNTKLRAAVMEHIRVNGTVTTEEVMDLMRPYADIDPETAAEQALRKRANSYIAAFRDDDDVRVCFAYKDENGHRRNAHVELTNDPLALFAISAQLKKRITGLESSRKKVVRRIAVLEGQLALPGLDNASVVYNYR